MAVLVEGITVIVDCRAIVQLHQGGQARFKSDLPNNSLRSDGELAAVTFMTPTDVKKYVNLLGERGLRYFEGEGAINVVVVDQHGGMRARCNWAEFGTTNWNNQKGQIISVCQSVPTQMDRVVVPQGWTYEESLTATGVYIPAAEIPSSLKLLRRETNRDVLLDEEHGRELYVYRSLP